MSMEELKYFFSYARKDSDFVLKLAKELRAVGVNLWLDQLDILGGQRWDRAVEGALETCQGIIVVLSPESLASNNVMDEVSYALEKEKLVVPVLLHSCDIPFRLRRVQHIDFTADHDTGFSQLLRALQIEQPLEKTEPLQLGKGETQEIETPVGETLMEGESKPPEAHQPADAPPVEIEERKRKETATTEPKSPKPRRTSNALKFGVSAGVAVLLIVGIWWWFSQQKIREVRQNIEKLDEQILNLENGISDIDKLEQIDKLYGQRDTLSHQAEALNEQAAEVGLVPQLKEIQNRLEKVKSQLANKVTKNSIGMEFVLISAGSYTMGSSSRI